MNSIIFCAQLIVIGATTLLVQRSGAAALTASLCVQAVLANLFVLKQIELLHLNATASDVYMIGCVLTLNLLQEYYGKQIARKTIWTSFVLLLFYTIMSQLHILYIPSISDFSQVHYQALLSYMPRLATASLVVYMIVQYFDTFFYAFIRALFQGRYLTFRNIVSITTSQLLDTVLFSFLGLYGIIDNIVQVMIVSFTIKMIAMLLLVPGVMALQKYVSGNTA
jgi:queuosine precursor transporter